MDLDTEATVCRICDEEAAESCQAGRCADCCGSNRCTGPFQCCDGHWVYEQREQHEEMEYTSCVMCRAEFYKKWSAERICDECEEAAQATREDERADRIAVAQQVRQALEAANFLVEQMNKEQQQEHR